MTDLLIRALLAGGPYLWCLATMVVASPILVLVWALRRLPVSSGTRPTVDEMPTAPAGTPFVTDLFAEDLTLTAADERDLLDYAPPAGGER